MKKHILAIILCVLCASLALVLASCGGDTNTSTDCSQGHNFGDWTTETYASCTSAGLKVRVCKDCAFEEEEAIPSGHKFGEWETVTEKTCDQDGLDRRVCSVCDFEEKDEFKAEGHKFGDWVITEQGSCDKDSTTERVCSVCDKKETDTIPGDGHNFSEWGFDLVGDPFVKNASCEEKGYIGRECIDCGEQEFQETDALGHTWGNWDVTGSCAAGATKTRECTVCGEDETETTAAGEHANIVFEGAVEATREQDGSTGTKKCLACGEILAGAKIIRIVNLATTSTVEANAEYWAFNNSYLIDGNRETGLCSSPKITSIKNTFTFAQASNVYEVILVVNSKGKTSEGGNYSEVTNNDYDISFVLYDEDGKAIFRSEQYKTLDQTEIVVAIELPEGKTAKSMSIIRSKQAYIHENYLWEVEILNKLYLSPCDADGHNWGEGWKTVSNAVCTPDSLTDGLEKRTCSVCGEVEENVIVAKHNWTEWDMSGITCTTGGTKTRECKACGKSVSESIAAGGHLNVELQGKLAPTLEADGHTGNYVCTACGTTVEAGTVIPKIVNQSASATVGTTGGWAIDGSTGSKDTRPYLNDGDMNTGMTVYTAQRNTVHSLTWANAVSIDTIKLYFSGDTTDKTVGHLSGSLASTNPATTITVRVYGADGTTVIKTESIATLDLTEYTIDLGAVTEVTKIELDCLVNWNGALIVNIWECQAYTKYVG